MFGKRILVLAAHPDDEVVGFAASILRAREAGAEVYVQYLTHGCLARETMWSWQRKEYENIVATRKSEAEAAARVLGLTPLNEPERPARSLWREIPQVWDEVTAMIARRRPDQVWVPAYEGGNPDHDALNAIGYKLKSRVSVLEFAEYNYFGGTAKSQTFIYTDETTRVAFLSDKEKETKRLALRFYESERGNLSYVKLDQESYRPIAPYDYARPPHQGTLWYERFQWVPFRHPRVDFTKSPAVSAAIVDFMLATPA